MHGLHLRISLAHSRPCKIILLADLGGSIACPRKLHAEPKTARNPAINPATGRAEGPRFAQTLARLEMGGNCHDAITTNKVASYQECVACFKVYAGCKYCVNSETKTHNCVGQSWQFNKRPLFKKIHRCPQGSKFVGGDQFTFLDCEMAFPTPVRTTVCCFISVT